LQPGSIYLECGSRCEENKRITQETSMTTTVTLEEATARLPQLIDGLTPGDSVVITKNAQIVAKLVFEQNSGAQRPPPGMGKGSVLYMAPDFDGPMEEFKEYEE
jgi:antitoxin (DNA-binding transcriptional repressor) of toxin-antitoxin stability system